MHLKFTENKSERMENRISSIRSRLPQNYQRIARNTNLYVQFDVSRILFSMIYAAPENDDYYAFYKMPTATVKGIYEKFFRVYFGCGTIEEEKSTSSAEK